MRNSIFVHRPDEIPKTEHWAIIDGSSVTVPGDERSRTHPGHGYPEHTDHFITYEAFTNEEEFKKELARRLQQNPFRSRPVRGIHVLPVTTTIEVKIT